MFQKSRGRHAHGSPWPGIVALVSALLVIAPAVAASPVIGDVVVNPTATDITVTGVNFGTATPLVSIGNYPAQLAIMAHSATQVVAALPNGIPPGSYLLSVTAPGKGGGTDEFWLTIGAAGPQGPAGQQGFAGPQGPQGPQGAQGPGGSVSAIVRHFTRALTLAPGETGGVTSVCLAGEIAMSGGPTGLPAPPAFIHYSTLVWDGNNSGWSVEWGNNGTTSITVYPRTTAVCVPGTMRLP